MGFDSGLLGIDNVDHFDVVLMEGEAGEVVRVGVDEMFGDSIEFGHEPCLGCGWDGPRNGQESCPGGSSEGREG